MQAARNGSTLFSILSNDRKTKNDMETTFKNISAGQDVYLLDRAAMELHTAKVKKNEPHVNISYTMAAGAQGMMRDVTLEMDGKETTYTIPENLMVTYAGDLTLATSRPALAGDVERMKQEAEKALADVERHKRTIEKAGELMAELNPEVRKERETERRFKSIESDIGGIKGMITQLLEKLS